MITPGTVRSLMLPAISELIDLLGAKYMEPWSYITKYGEFGAGVFMPEEDVFSARFKGIDINQVVLHELTHWTGAVSRLNRPLFNKAAKYNYRCYRHEIGETMYHQEEAVAQFGMFKLAYRFGMDTEAAYNALVIYLDQFCPLADRVRANAQADEAVAYILDRAYGTKAA